MSEQDLANEVSHDTQNIKKKQAKPLLDKSEDTLELEALSYGYYAVDHSPEAAPLNKGR